MRSVSSLLIVVLTCGFSGVSAAALEEVAEASNVSELALVTGFHRVTHKGSGFDVRLLEADGSASVALDPVSLFLVVTNNGTSDNTQRIWRLPRGVERVRGMSPTTCGVDVLVDVDRIEDTVVAGRDPKVLHLCFLAENRTLRSKLSVTEVSAVAKRKAG
jgi:hypothetical protein